MTYKPGLHILSEIKTAETGLLIDYIPLKELYETKIREYGLSKVGEVFHAFDGAGFTGVICLTESHLSVHTWPEFGLLTFDVFLSNFSRNNDEVTRKLFKDTIDYFQSADYTCKEVRR